MLLSCVYVSLQAAQSSSTSDLHTATTDKTQTSPERKKKKPVSCSVHFALVLKWVTLSLSLSLCLSFPSSSPLFLSPSLPPFFLPYSPLWIHQRKVMLPNTTLHHVGSKLVGCLITTSRASSFIRCSISCPLYLEKSFATLKGCANTLFQNYV